MPDGGVQDPHSRLHRTGRGRATRRGDSTFQLFLQLRFSDAWIQRTGRRRRRLSAWALREPWGGRTTVIDEAEADDDSGARRRAVAVSMAVGQSLPLPNKFMFIKRE